ncbi:MAG: hypothetical protein ABI779_25940 [Acidobacteriota bacterium]
MLQLWRNHKLPIGHRIWVALLAIILTSTFWPHELSPCPPSKSYLLAALIVALFGYLAHRAEEEIWERHGYNQQRKTGTGVPETTEQVLGGPVLTPRAKKLMLENSWTAQRVFDSLHSDIKETFEEDTWTRLVRQQRFLAASSQLAYLIALALLLAFLCLLLGVRLMHRPLSVTPSTDIVLPGGGEKIFDASLQECDNTVVWTIHGSPAKKAKNALGKVEDGFYSAPDLVEEDTELYVVATPVHRREEKKIHILLKAHVPYAKPLPAAGTDDEGKSAEFQVEIIDKQYAWIYEDYVLSGVDGAAFAKRMNADGLFRPFDAIICIGAASREYTKPKDEQDRAERRAKLLAGWVRDALGARRVDVLALKIGRYDAERRDLTPEQTEGERRVVLVGVKNADPNVDLMAALRDAFAKLRHREPILDDFLNHYPQEGWKFVDLRQ